MWTAAGNAAAQRGVRACLVATLAVDLEISEIVEAECVVSAVLPLAVFSAR
jgi:acetamidase/formamidase